MWAAYAKLKKEINISNIHYEMNNEQLIKFINKHRKKCSEFDNALKWLGTRNVKQALDECKVPMWTKWLRDAMGCNDTTILKEGDEVTITHGVTFKYAVWSSWILDVPEDYIDENTIRVFVNG